MKKTLLFLALFGAAASVDAQYVEFETPVLDADTAWFGQDQVVEGDTTTYYEGPYSDQISFTTSYETAPWGFSWSGFAISNVTDTATTGSDNQFSCISGEGADASSQYLISYGTGTKIYNEEFGSTDMISLFVNNSTYTYHSIKNGDAFGKRFGDSVNADGNVDGTNGEDWLLLTIYSLNDDSLRTGDSVNFYLADYRFADSLDDYIVTEWTEVDLSNLPWGKRGVEFVLTSSDAAPWGMNTPNYFALDNIHMEVLENINEVEVSAPSMYPNPTNDIVSFNLTDLSIERVEVYNQLGQKLTSFVAKQGMNSVNLSQYGKGLYLMKFVGASSQAISKVLVH